MSKLSASKRTRTFQLLPRCPFCCSNRIGIVHGDDDGPYATVKCSACECEGPHVRARVWESRDVTHEITDEAVGAWNAIWDQMTGRPDQVEVDGHGNEIIATPRKRRRRLARPALVRPAPAVDHQVHVAAPPKATNGQNGHHNGSVA